jgi:hypothetical protein
MFKNRIYIFHRTFLFTLHLFYSNILFCQAFKDTFLLSERNRQMSRHQAIDGVDQRRISRFKIWLFQSFKWKELKIILRSGYLILHDFFHYVIYSGWNKCKEETVK